MRALAIAIGLALLVPGCTSTFKSCPVPELGALGGPFDTDARLQRAAGGPVEVLYWAQNTDERTLTSEVTIVDPPREAAVRQISTDAETATPGGAYSFGVIGLDTGELATGPTSLTIRFAFRDSAGGSCVAREAATRLVPLGPVVEQPRVAGGQGFLVRTAGFWTNGTLFYTNIGDVHNSTVVPKNELGEYAGTAPLKVYVYNQSRDEMPPRYDDAGYTTTIPGFNAALREMWVMSGHAVVVPPEEAYTDDEHRDHALYGDTLVFHIEVLARQDAPCPVPPPLCEIPEAPVG